jgi:hypothetical protein
MNAWLQRVDSTVAMQKSVARRIQPLQIFQRCVENALIGYVMDFIDDVTMTTLADVVAPFPDGLRPRLPFGAGQIL